MKQLPRTNPRTPIRLSLCCAVYCSMKRWAIGGATRWPALMMAVAAAATALGAYLIGTLTNEAYVSRNFRGIVVIGVLGDGGVRRQGSRDLRRAVLLSHIGNRIVANNQRRMFDKLLRENIELLRRSSFVGIHFPADNRRRGVSSGHQSSDHRRRPRSHVVDRAVAS